MAKEKEGLAENTKCPACNASISFNPKLQKFKCDYCGAEFTIEDIKANASKKEKEEVKENNEDYVQFRCESCGAEVVTDSQTTATFCVYCGNTVVLKEKVEGTFKPDYIIPFSKTKEEAVEAFKNVTKGKPLTPKLFNDEKNIEKIRGVYIPFFMYDFLVNGELRMSGTRIKTWTRGRTHYTQTDIYNIFRKGSMVFDKVPSDASTRFDDDMMETIEPFKYEALVPFEKAFLSGFLAERYDEKEETVVNKTSNRAKTTTRDIMFADPKMYSSKVIQGETFNVEVQNKYYALLPVWMVNVKYNNKPYLFAMNGQTGEFIGNLPTDPKKVVLYFILIFVITFLVILIGFYFFGSAIYKG